MALIAEVDQSKLPIGAQGAAAVDVDGDKGAWAALRMISIRTTAWPNRVDPL